MRRVISSFLAIALLVMPGEGVQAATPKAGQPCSKLNLTQNVGSLKYTCIKSGSKLVWDKGVKVTGEQSSQSNTSCAGGVRLGIATKERISENEAVFKFDAGTPCSYKYVLKNYDGTILKTSSLINVPKAIIQISVSNLTCDSIQMISLTAFTLPNGGGSSVTFQPNEIPWCGWKGTGPNPSPSPSPEPDCSGVLNLKGGSAERSINNQVKFTYDALYPCSYSYMIKDSQGRVIEKVGPINVRKTVISFITSKASCNSGETLSLSVYAKPNGQGSSMEFPIGILPPCQANPGQVTPSPVTLPINTNPIRNFSELSSRYLDFHEIARIKAVTTMNSEKPKSIQFNLKIGPNSKLCNKSPETILKQMSSLYSLAKQPNVINLLVADDQDQGWLESETRKLLPEDQIEIVNGKMMNPEKVNRLTGEGVVWWQNSCSLSDFMTTSGGGLAHGFTHVFQISQFFPQSNTWGAWGKIPHWLLEGGATFSENIVAYGSSENTWRSALPFHDSDLKKYDQQFFLDFLKLSDQGWTYTDKWPNHRVYDVGALVGEVLIAVGSPSDLLNLYSEYQITQDFDKAFKNIYGVSWTEAEPLIATAIYRFIQATF